MDVFSFAASFAHHVGAFQLDDSSIALIALLGGMYGGYWINGRHDRSRYYNHSTFADLVITGVVGLCPRADDVVEVDPLLPASTWDWFCLDGVKYHGHFLTIIWDRIGTHYGHGQGLIVLADGHEIAHGTTLSKLTGKLP